MTETHIWHHEKLGKKVVEALKKNRFNAEYVATMEEARQRVLESIPIGASVGFGGSMTIKQLGIANELEKQGHELFDHSTPGLTREEKKRMRQSQHNSDVFLTSTNAVTLDGQLVNVDGSGNRVAAMIYGPKKVIIVAGVNKIVKDVKNAMDRIEMCIAPMNNYRLGFANPCTKTGYCVDCDSESRICNVTTIMRKKTSQTDITVLIVGEELGL